MKKSVLNALALIVLAVFVISGCNTHKQPGNADGSYSKVFYSNMDNPDSLAALAPSVWKNMKTLVETSAYSGKYCSKIDTVNIFSFLYENSFNQIEGVTPKQVLVSAYGYAIQPNTKARLVVSVSGDKYYKAIVADSLFVTPGEWKEIKGTFNLPTELGIYDVVKAYVFNDKTGELLVDNLRVEFIYPKRSNNF